MRGLLLALLLVGNAAAETLPSQVLDLTRWKLNMPEAGPKKGAREVRQPELAGYVHPDFFHVAAEGKGVVFRAPCGGVATKNSDYPRTELREMGEDNKSAAWSTTDGQVHRLEWEGAFTHLPEKKPEAVCVQIHDAKDDVLMVRLEKQHLFVERNHQGEEPTLARDYQPGTRFKIIVEAADGRIRLWYNDQLALDNAVAAQGCYFKAGCYTQSNPAQGDAPEAYGETLIYTLKVTHTAKP